MGKRYGFIGTIRKMSGTDIMGVRIPFAVHHALKQSGQHNIHGTVNGTDFSSSLTDNGKGVRFMTLDDSVITQAGLELGVRVSIVLNM